MLVTALYLLSKTIIKIHIKYYWLKFKAVIFMIIILMRMLN